MSCKRETERKKAGAEGEMQEDKEEIVEANKTRREHELKR